MKLLFLVLLVFPLGCGGGGGGAEQDLPAPSTAASLSIYLTTNRIFVDVARGPNGANLAARVVDRSGQPVANAAVRFTTDLGWFDNNAQAHTALTGSSGIAFATLTSGAVGQARARAETVNSALSDTVDVFFTLQSVQSARIDLMADPPHTMAGAATTITARLSDENNRPIPFTTITFTYGNSTFQAQTNLSGIASVIVAFPTTLTASASVLVLASARFPFGTITEFITLTGSPTVIPGDGIVVSLGNMQRNAITGEISYPVTASVLDEQGRPVGGAAVRFSPTTGQIVGFAVTDANGQATATWYLGSYTGRASLTAFIGVVSASVTVTVGTPAPVIPQDGVSLSLGATQIDTVTQEISYPVMAAVLDENGRPAQGITVRFSSTQGTIIGFGVTDPNGLATATWYLGTYRGSAALTASVGAVSDSVTVSIIPSAPPLFITPAQATLRGINQSTRFDIFGGVPPYAIALSDAAFVEQSFSLATDHGVLQISTVSMPSEPVDITIYVADSAGSAVTATLTLDPTIAPVATVSELTITASGGATEVATGDVIQFFATGGAPPYTWTAGGGLWDTNGDLVGDSAAAASVWAQPVAFVAGTAAGRFFIHVTDTAGNVANYGIEIMPQPQ